MFSAASGVFEVLFWFVSTECWLHSSDTSDLACRIYLSSRLPLRMCDGVRRVTPPPRAVVPYGWEIFAPHTLAQARTQIVRLRAAGIPTHMWP